VLTRDQAIEAKHVEVHNSNAPVGDLTPGGGLWETIKAENISLRTSNASIVGYFDASSSVLLKTCNGPITANVELHSRAGDNPAVLQMHTTNGYAISPYHLFENLRGLCRISQVKSFLYLKADTDSQWGGAFNVSAQTTNAPLLLSFSDSPPDHTLHLRVSTTKNSADVHLHRTFEGAFSAHTSSDEVSITPAIVEDPKGHGRTRRIDILESDPQRQSVGGRVSWGEPEAEFGDVEVINSMAPIRLTL
jgi:hypothetical protein